MQINEQELLREKTTRSITKRKALLLLAHEADIPCRSRVEDNDDANAVRRSKIDRRGIKRGTASRGRINKYTTGFV